MGSNGTVAVNPAGIPDDLKVRPQWVLWKIEQRNGKPTKIPKQVNGHDAKSNDASTWTTSEKALTAYTQVHERGGPDGVGYVFSDDDPYVGIDLDACRDPESGTITPWAMDVINAIASYTEISPSSFGVKIVAKAKHPHWARHVFKHEKLEAIGSKTPEIAIYDTKRFWTMTGHHLDGTPTTIESRQQELENLCKRLWKKPDYDQPAKNAGPSENDHAAAVEPFALNRNANMPAAVAAMMRVPVPPQENDGSNRLLQVVRQCKRFGLNEDQTCHAVGLYETQRPFPRGWATADIARRWQDSDVAAGEMVPDEEPITVFPTITGRDLMENEYKREFLVDGLVVKGRPLLVCGPPKSFKTTIAIELALAMAAGGTFLSEFHADNSVRVGVMTGEADEAELQDIASRICETRKWNLALLPIVFSTRCPKVVKVADVEGMKKWVKDNSLDFLFLDPAYKVMPGENVNIVNVQGDALSELTDICHTVGATLGLIHHFTKAGGYKLEEPPQLLDASQAGYAEWAAQWMLLRKRGQSDNDGNHQLYLVQGGRGFGERTWGLDVNEGTRNARTWQTGLMTCADVFEIQKRDKELRDAKTAAERAAERERKVAGILRHLGNEWNGITQIAKAAQMNKEMTGGVLEELAVAGRCQREWNESYGGRWLYQKTDRS